MIIQVKIKQQHPPSSYHKGNKETQEFNQEIYTVNYLYNIPNHSNIPGFDRPFVNLLVYHHQENLMNGKGLVHELRPTIVVDDSSMTTFTLPLQGHVLGRIPGKKINYCK